MIKKFTFKNFGSFKEKTSISFETSNLTDETLYNGSFILNNNSYLKINAFYGENACGKSTIIKALSTIPNILNPQSQTPLNILYYPYRFSEECQKAPIEIEIEFSPSTEKNNYLYRYLIAFDSECIVREELSKLTSQKFSQVFVRKDDLVNNHTVVTIGQSFNSQITDVLAKSVVKGIPFLKMFKDFRLDDYYDCFEFLSQNLICISPEVSRFSDYSPSPNKFQGDYKTFLLKLLNACDFNIEDVKIGKKKIRNLTPYGINEQERNSLILNHKGCDGNGGLDFLLESLGTKKIVVLADFLYSAFSKSQIVAIDELEASLHPDLTRMIVELFMDETINKHNSQLLFTSHETTLLDLSLFRREQINFVYKNSNNCSSFINTLSEFSVRKTDNIAKAYLSGRFGTSPDIVNSLLRN